MRHKNHSPIAMIEDKSQRFERLAQRRVSEALNQLRLIGNLSDRRNYSYTPEHVREMFDVLENELRSVRAKFRSESLSDSAGFKFKKDHKKKIRD